MNAFYSGADKYYVLNDRDSYGAVRASRKLPSIGKHSGALRHKSLRVHGRAVMNHLSAALGIIHRAIIAAKMRRVQRELMFHARANHDAGDVPQRPLILGDKWDF